MKKIVLVGTIAALVTVIAAPGGVFTSPANAVNTSEKKTSSGQENDSTQKLVLPEKEFRQAFQALFIKRIDPPVPMLDFTLRNLRREKINTKTLRGKFLWLNFWSTRCVPCVQEIPSMQKVWEKFGGETFMLLAVAVGETKNSVLSFLENNRLQVTFPVLLDPRVDVFNRYGAIYFPTSLFIGPEGNIIGVAIGAREWENEKFYILLDKISSKS